jgi:hypothetical protein
MSIRDWLDSVVFGLGVYAPTIEAYGPLTVIDIAAFDDDDIEEVQKLFKAAYLQPPPHEWKLIVKAMRKEMAKGGSPHVLQLGPVSGGSPTADTSNPMQDSTVCRIPPP